MTAHTLTDARRLWMVWWNRNAPDLLNLRAKHHAEGQRAFQHLLTEARADVRTDEAIERVAESIWTTDPEPALEPFDGPETWEVLEPELKDDYRHAARHAINSLLGEEP